MMSELHPETTRKFVESALEEVEGFYREDGADPPWEVRPNEVQRDALIEEVIDNITLVTKDTPHPIFALLTLYALQHLLQGFVDYRDSLTDTERAAVVRRYRSDKKIDGIEWN